MPNQQSHFNPIFASTVFCLSRILVTAVAITLLLSSAFSSSPWIGVMAFPANKQSLVPISISSSKQTNDVRRSPVDIDLQCESAIARQPPSIILIKFPLFPFHFLCLRLRLCYSITSKIIKTWRLLNKVDMFHSKQQNLVVMPCHAMVIVDSADWCSCWPGFPRCIGPSYPIHPGILRTSCI